MSHTLTSHPTLANNCDESNDGYCRSKLTMLLYHTMSQMSIPQVIKFRPGGELALIERYGERKRAPTSLRNILPQVIGALHSSVLPP